MPDDGTIRLAWASDIHLGHADPEATAAFCRRVHASGASALLLGGDISVAPELVADLGLLADAVGLPIRFVLGNHDYYGGSVAAVRQQVAALDDPRLDWLEGTGWRELAPGVGLVGEGGWGDARLGTFATSTVLLNDYLVIAELRRVFATEAWDGTLGGQDALRAALQALGDEAAARLRPSLRAAAAACDQVIVLCHVAPFAAATFHEGRMSEPEFLPGFACGATGEVIAAVAADHPGCRFTLLCGHTHGGGTAAIAPNVFAHVQAARYGAPDFLLVEGGRRGISVGSSP
ncbi:MAG: metallophosphoesterase [Candidatus Krumholzibacteriia bacterium]